MADTKVSSLPVATSVGGSDILYLVQSNSSKRVTAATLFNNAANVTLKGNVYLDSTVQTLSSPGTIDVTKIVTQLTAGPSGGDLAIPVGLTGQLKVIALTATTGGTYTLKGNIANNANVNFTTTGDTATLLYMSSKWFVIGGTASIT